MERNTVKEDSEKNKRLDRKMKSGTNRMEVDDRNSEVGCVCVWGCLCAHVHAQLEKQASFSLPSLTYLTTVHLAVLHQPPILVVVARCPSPQPSRPFIPCFILVPQAPYLLSFHFTLICKKVAMSLFLICIHVHLTFNVKYSVLGK